MATVKQAFEFYRKALRDGKGDMKTGHPYIAEEEERKRQDNAPDEQGRRKTRIAWDACDADSYTEWQVERGRWMGRAHKNPTVCTDAQILALRRYKLEEIDALIQTLGEARAKIEAAKAEASGVPRAVIPAWQEAK